MSQTKMEDYVKAKYIDNSKVEWLIEEGQVSESVYFKGETGDRYTIYLFTKRNKNIVDIYTVSDTYGHDTYKGSHTGSIKNYIFTVIGGKHWSWRGGAGEIVKQLMRQGVCPFVTKQYKIRYCRSAYFMKTHDGNQFTPWVGMKIDLKTGLLVNKPSRLAIKEYKKAKETDKTQRKRNYIANRENTKALERYRKAGGDTVAARTRWNNGRNETVIDPTLETMDWDMIPMDDMFRHRNATLRSNIIEHYGMNAIINTLEHEVVDEETIDGRHYKLLNVTIPDWSDTSLQDNEYKGLYLEMINPSTGESHFEGVPNASDANWGNHLKEATVKAALTWRDNDILIKNTDSYNRGGSSGNDYVKPIVLK